MKKIFFKNNSIYLNTGLIIITTVVIIMSLSTTFSYYQAKERIDNKVQQEAQQTLIAVEDHILGLIQSYSVNEYRKIIANEVNHGDLLALIVEDRNMGAILGEEVYIKGHIRDENWEIIDFDPQNTKHQQRIRQAHYCYDKEIITPEGQNLGKIRLYASDRELQKQFQNLLLENLIQALSISLLLIISLFFLVRSHILKPLIDMSQTIALRHNDGLPKNSVPVRGPREIKVLGQTLNRMIRSIKSSQKEITEKSEALQNAKERFQLAVDGTKDGLWDWDLTSNHFYFSDRFATMLGYQPNEITPSLETLIKLIHPHDLDETQYRIDSYLKDPHSENFENTFRMKTKGGDWKWITARGKALCDDQGKAVRFVGFNTDVTKIIEQQHELEEQKQILQYYASHDSLTGLANRSLFNDRLSQSINKSIRHNQKFAVFFIDLDFFKEINDSLGHDIGDKVLQSVAKRLQNIIRAEDTFARLGGDEFTIIIEDLRQATDASLLAEKVIEALSKPVEIERHELRLGCSIGISIYPDNGKNPTDLLKNADAAMYRAKNQGRNNFQYYSKEMTEEAFNRLKMEASIRTGIQNEEFVVYYQPQIRAESGHLIGMEALVRWNSPTLGFVSPAEFIPVAIATGVIVELDRYVMQKAVSQVSQWHQQGLTTGRLSMNLNMKQLQRDDFIPFLKQLISHSRCSAHCIELEITEGELMNDPEKSIGLLQQIEKLGITLSLDDFGTGYSSLSYLKKLPISKLKIDQSFVRDLPDDIEDAAICDAIIALADSLNLQILAEGTETRQQVDFLVQAGCPDFQGYYYARPMPASELETYLIEKPFAIK